MADLLDNLKKLNRKERFWLIGQALGNPKFTLDTTFREMLGEKLGLTIPPTAFAAMDYHLNWIYAATVMTCEPVSEVYSNELKAIDGTQEDVDLLISYKDDVENYHLIMVEAKGDTAFDNAQFLSKMGRLKNIFNNKCHWRIRPHLVLMSPNPPQKLKVDECPPWLKTNGIIPWVELNMPRKDLFAVVRCDKNGGKSRVGGYWTLQ
jgi:hypothetical protein